MVRFVVLIALAGCGRVGFTNQTAGTDGAASDSDVVDVDVVPLGHDEDGDGVPDSADVCPHLVDSQGDTDGDGVGDACDPNPNTGGEAFALFATMMPGDQPLAPGGDGDWIQLPDALELTGALGDDNNLYAETFLSLPVNNVRIAVGLDITAVLPDATSNQNQYTIAVERPAPVYFGEVNQITGLFDAAQVTLYDGANYAANDPQDLATGIHTGYVILTLTQVVNSGMTFSAVWPPAESYVAQISDSIVGGGNMIAMRTNNLHLEILWLVVITSP